MNEMKTVDLNADLGEGSPGEDELFGVATSVNIACGAHAGDLAAMRAALRAAKATGTSAGAHPGYADPEYFGRRELALSPAQVAALVGAQLALLSGLARDEGVTLRHVKPHGALYNQAARDSLLAAAVVSAVRTVVPDAGLFAPAGSELARAAEEAGLRVWREAFADRSYRADGGLVPRGESDAVLGEDAALAQALEIVTTGRVRCVTGEWIPMTADTLCVHGDGPAAAMLLKGLRTALGERGVEVRTVA